MKNRYYGLMNKPNDGVKDDAPDWMESLFENKESNKKENPFKDSSNFLLNSNTRKVETCDICNSVLKDNEIEFCNNCL